MTDDCNNFLKTIELPTKWHVTLFQACFMIKGSWLVKYMSFRETLIIKEQNFGQDRPKTLCLLIYIVEVCLDIASAYKPLVCQTEISWLIFQQIDASRKTDDCNKFLQTIWLPDKLHVVCSRHGSWLPFHCRSFKPCQMHEVVKWDYVIVKIGLVTFIGPLLKKLYCVLITCASVFFYCCQ